MPILDFEKFLFKLHPEKLSPRIKELVEMAKTAVVTESHPAVVALNHKEATTLLAACEHELHALTTVGMPRPPALEGTVAALDKAWAHSTGPFDLEKAVVPVTSPVPRGKDIHPMVDHIVGIVSSGSDHAQAYQELRQLAPDLVQQVTSELKGAQHDLFTSGRTEIGHSIDQFLAPLEIGELVPKRGMQIHSNVTKPIEQVKHH